MNIRDRIKELRRVRAGDLRPHPKDWRKHPQEQHDALRGILAEVGFVDALKVVLYHSFEGILIDLVSLPFVFSFVHLQSPSRGCGIVQSG